MHSLLQEINKILTAVRNRKRYHRGPENSAVNSYRKRRVRPVSKHRECSALRRGGTNLLRIQEVWGKSAKRNNNGYRRSG